MKEGGSVTITKDMYRKALHIYLIHAYPDDDMQYYSKWAWLVRPTDEYTFWKSYHHGDSHPFPEEARFGCQVSGNTKLRCYPTGFMFDPNDSGDPPEVIAEVERLKKVIEEEWEKAGLPIHGRGFE